MDTSVRRIITAERGRLVPHIERLAGIETRDSFWGAFESAASRFALGKLDAPEFRAVVGELTRDASGTAAQQDRNADTGAPCGAVADTTVRNPWATMPTDGSGTMGRAERAVVFLTGVVSAVVLVWIGFLITGMVGTSPDAPPLNIPAATAADMREADTDMITRGAYWSWEAAQECARGDRSCDAALARINGEAARYGLHVWEDGSLSPLGN